jgi:hypothetical protein
LAKAHLLDCQNEFLVLITSSTGKAFFGKAGKKYQCVTDNGTSDLGSPVLTGPQVGCVPPQRYPSSLKRALQLVDVI